MIKMEIGFNILYLLTIYLIVFLMFRKYRSQKFINTPGSRSFLAAFLLLAIGDTGHVGFRLVAFARGGLETNESLVGLGALATAITVTIFYMLMAEVWSKQAGKPRKLIYWTIIGLGLVRLGFMTLEGNQWNQVVPPHTFSLYRNAFLTAMGLLVILAFMRSGKKSGNRFLTRSGIAIICSFVFYIPVILFVQKVPMIGMLMIPKTIVYVWLALIGVQRLFVSREL